MKKSIFIVLALILMSQLAFADNPWELNDQKYVIANDASSGKTTHISTSIIRPDKDRVLKVTVCPTDRRSDAFVGIYDCTTAAGTLVSALEGEFEAKRDAGSESYEYKRPLRIFNGVTILQGPYTTVTLEWEKSNP